MFESYSKQALASAKNSLRILDDNLNYDFEEDKPEGIPSISEFEVEGFGDLLFNSEKKQKARKRKDFNAGVIYEVCMHHYDGKQRGFESFCLKAIRGLIAMGGTVANAFKKSLNNQSPEFNIGKNWGKKFIKIRITFEEEAIEDEIEEEKNINPDTNVNTDPELSEHERIEEDIDKDLIQARDYFYKIRELVNKTKETRFQFYKEWVQSEIENDLLIENEKKEFYEINLLRDNTEGGKLLKPADWEIDLDDYLKLSKKKREIYDVKFQEKLLKLEPDFWFDSLKDKLHSKQKKFLKKLISYINSLNKLGFNFDLESNDNIKKHDFFYADKIIKKYPKVKEFNIYLRDKDTYENNSYHDWVWINGFTDNKPLLLSSNRIRYPAHLNFNSSTTELVNYKNDFVKDLLKQFDNKSYKKVIEESKNFDEIYFNEESPLEVTFTINFIYCLESALNNFILDDLPIKYLSFTRNMINSLIPYDTYDLTVNKGYDVNKIFQLIKNKDIKKPK